MKLLDLYESRVDPVGAIIAGLEASLVPKATVHSFGVGGNNGVVVFQLVYDSPEDYESLAKSVRGAVGKVAKRVTVDGVDDALVSGASYQLLLKKPLTPEEVRAINFQVTSKYTPAVDID